MTKKKAWQTLFLMSVIFSVYQLLFQHRDDLFLEKQAKDIMYSGIRYSLTEMFPLLMYEESTFNIEHLMENLTIHLKEEVFPAIDYCEKYWQDTEGLISKREDIPSYYLETDESKTEQYPEVETEYSETKVDNYTEEQSSIKIDDEVHLATGYTLNLTEEESKKILSFLTNQSIYKAVRV